MSPPPAGSTGPLHPPPAPHHDPHRDRAGRPTGASGDTAPGTDPSTLTVSVVVTHFEQPRELARTLAALALQDQPALEVIVSDDGSATTPTVPDGVRLVGQQDLGFRAAAARNNGAAEATGDLLVFLDADTAPEASYLRELTAPLRAERDLLVVGRRRYTRFAEAGVDVADPLAGAGDDPLPEPAWLSEGWRDTDDLRDADETSFRFVISATLACDAMWFERVGGFDDTFVGYGGEDWELAHRWWTAGGRLRHAPDAVAWHDGHPAGEGDRALDPVDEARTAEAVAVASRVNVAPVAFRGLRVAPARVLVTHDADIDDRELLISIDGLLAGCPQADVVSDNALLLSLGDPRVSATPGPYADRAQLGVHLHRGAYAEPATWAAFIGGIVPGGGADVSVETPVVTVTDLQCARRAEVVAGESGVCASDVDSLRPVGDRSLAAWLGGWEG